MASFGGFVAVGTGLVVFLNPKKGAAWMGRPQQQIPCGNDRQKSKCKNKGKDRLVVAVSQVPESRPGEPGQPLGGRG